MQYQEIIDTIKVGDVIEHEFDGHLIVDEIDIEDTHMTLRCGWWRDNVKIIRKVSSVEVQQELSTTNTQDSQNENDNSQCGNEIVVGSKWVPVSDYAVGRGFKKTSTYTTAYSFTHMAYFEDENGSEWCWVYGDGDFKRHFKPVVEQSTEQLASQEPSGGVVKAGEVCDPEPPSLVKLQYDPRDVAFHRNTARWWLEKAIDIQKYRASEYDKEQERSASNVAKIFNILRDKNLTEADVFLILQILKQVRYCQNFDNPHEDSLLDNVSYASLFAEAAMRSKNTL